LRPSALERTLGQIYHHDAKKMKVKTAFVVLFALAAVGGVGWKILEPASLELISPTRGPAVEAVYATGVVEPVHWVKVAPTLTARLIDLLTKEGEDVLQGQPIAKLDDGEAKARLNELEARERFLSSELARVKTLAAKEFASSQSLDRARSELIQTEAARAAAERRLMEYTLLAPMSGQVLRRDGEPGEVIQTGQVLFTIGQKKPLRVTAEIDEEDITRIHVGQKVLLKADAFPGRNFEGVISEVTPKGDPLNKSYRARIALPDDAPLPIGMTVEANPIVRIAPDALLIPASALVDGGVWLVKDGRLERRAVKVGTVGEAKVEIREGLSEQDRVALSPSDKLKPGQRVSESGAVARTPAK
jgi:RND family efflux transporter MFP subunit